MVVSKTVVGVFRSRNQAEKAVNELKEFGLGRDEISIVSRDESRSGVGKEGRMTSEVDVAGQDLSSGVAWGGGIGGAAGLLAGAGALAIPGVGPILAAGPLAALLTGAVTGGLAGGLVDYGIPEESGRKYEERVKQGDILTVVHAADDTAKKVEDILRRNGAEDVETHEGKKAR